jgi:hypothetical protein
MNVMNIHEQETSASRFEIKFCAIKFLQIYNFITKSDHFLTTAKNFGP